MGRNVYIKTNNPLKQTINKRAYKQNTTEESIA